MCGVLLPAVAFFSLLVVILDRQFFLDDSVATTSARATTGHVYDPNGDTRATDQRHQSATADTSLNYIDNATTCTVH